MIELLRAQTLSEAYGLQAALAAAGVAAVVQGEHSIGIIGGGVSVRLVNDADADKARAVLGDFRTP